MRNKFAAFAAVLALSCPAWATLTTTTNSASYTGNGSTTAFTVPFKFLANADLVVTVAGVTKALGSDYSVKGAGNATGTVTMTTAPASGAAVVITRSVPLTQTTSLRQSRSFDPATIENALDRTTMQIQQNAATHTADKTAQAARDTAQDSALATTNASQDAATAAKDAAQDAATASVFGAVSGLNTGSHAVGDTTSILAFGSTTPETLTSRFAYIPTVKNYGLACDGVTNDFAALSAMVTALGTTQKITLSLRGLCVVNSDVSIPTNIRLRLEGEGSGFTGTGKVTFASWSPHLNDTPALNAPLIDMDHYATSIVNGFGINIRNQADNPAAPTAGTGAGTSIVVHQYSDSSPAVQIDNTRGQPFIRFKEASNATNSVGTQGTGDFFSFFGYTASSPSTNLEIGRLDQFLAFRGLDSSRPWQFVGGSTGPALQIAQGNAGTGLNLIQSGAGAAVNVSQTGAATAVQIVPGAGADGFAALNVNARTHGATVSTSQVGAGQYVLQAVKNGVGAGDTLNIINKGTDKTIRMQNATGNTSSFGPNGELTIGSAGTAIGSSSRGTFTTVSVTSVGGGGTAQIGISLAAATAGTECASGFTGGPSLMVHTCVIDVTNHCIVTFFNYLGSVVTLPSGTVVSCRAFNP